MALGSVLLIRHPVPCEIILRLQGPRHWDQRLLLRPQIIENWLCGTQDPHLEAPDHLESTGLELLGQIQV